MEGLPEEFDFELEALRATYGDDAVQAEAASSAAGGSSGGSPPVAVVSLPVAPRCEAEHEQFVAGRLVMAVAADYPAEPPAVQLADAKGLGDARLASIQSALAAEAAAMAGELQLGHLVETALDLLTDTNQPEGGCAFCLEPLLGPDGSTAGGKSAAPAVLRLACYHCFHTACFAPWWQWQQRRSAEREAQLWSEYKSMAALKLEEEGIRREPLSWLPAGAGSSGSSSSVLAGSAANGMGRAAGEEQQEAEEGEEGGGSGGSSGSKGPAQAYVLLCPACRADIVPSSLAHTWQQLQAATAESWSSGTQGSNASGRAALGFLPPQQQQALLAMQQRHAAVMRRQQACGGIVEASHSVSISDLQQAAAAAAAAEAAATEAAALAAAQQAQQAQGGAAGRGRGGRGGRGRGGPHHSSGRGPPPGFSGRQQREGDGDGSSRQNQSGRGRGGRGRGGGRGGRHSDGPAAGGASLAAAEGVLAGMQLGDMPQQPAQRQQQAPQQQAQQQHDGGRRPGGGRGGRVGRHGRGGGGRGRESAASSSAAAAPSTS